MPHKAIIPDSPVDRANSPESHMREHGDGPSKMPPRLVAAIPSTNNLEYLSHEPLFKVNGILSPVYSDGPVLCEMVRRSCHFGVLAR